MHRKQQEPGVGEVTANEWVEARGSEIHGRGVFALRDIPRGTRVIEYVGERVTKAESLRRALARLDEAGRTGDGAVYIFELNARHDIDGNVPWNLARLINHSCSANCESQRSRGKIHIVATRRIRAGEELSYDYGYDLEHWNEHPCRCGSERCVGYIVRRRDRARLRRLLAR